MTFHHELLAALAKDAMSYLEIGVQEGDSLAAVVRTNLSIDVALCDTWGGESGGTGRGDHAHIERRLDMIGHVGDRLYLDGKSEDLVPNLRVLFDLVHIDGDHSVEGARGDLLRCWPLTRKWLVVHDQFFQGVRDATFEFLMAHRDEFASVELSTSDQCTMVIRRAS